MIDAERVERAAKRLRELEASGVKFQRILGSEADIAFVRDECGGYADVAIAAFGILHFASERVRTGDREKTDRENRVY